MEKYQVSENFIHPCWGGCWGGARARWRRLHREEGNARHPGSLSEGRCRFCGIWICDEGQGHAALGVDRALLVPGAPTLLRCRRTSGVGWPRGWILLNLVLVVVEKPALPVEGTLEGDPSRSVAGLVNGLNLERKKMRGKKCTKNCEKKRGGGKKKKKWKQKYLREKKNEKKDTIKKNIS